MNSEIDILVNLFEENVLENINRKIETNVDSSTRKNVTLQNIEKHLKKTGPQKLRIHPPNLKTTLYNSRMEYGREMEIFRCHRTFKILSWTLRLYGKFYRLQKEKNYQILRGK